MLFAALFALADRCRYCIVDRARVNAVDERTL
jgi:hypothetical protein